ncbi:Carboxyl-terminal protease [Thioalkalivibrio nitratireducens DSM 14787]|uniref:Carboxyl-terminal protease n=1 Tax=Thioalkalivibrio nitratireducens (strain DSM 14787 / UNIQEM 213 / ALEN2) TaxID=1255043 RepID=L0E0K0_THIND|nr:S41 family peptidase [Thioalkalivibrio nitratireducens]AGA35354.1 Carboxyl-terminal protease [Thioalkalivibrio nitratireducens DSM 14787]
MNKRYSVGYGLVIGVILGLFLSVSVGVFADRHEGASAQIPVEDLRRFTDVYMRIKRNYVSEVEDRELLDNAIKGMLSGLDPHSAYLDEREFRDLQVGTSGEFGGLGIEVGMEDGFVKVIAPIDDTPASRAGIRAGDLIIRLDDTPVKGMSLSDAVSKMRGKRGTDITLTIMREGVDGPLRITITRDVIRVQSVRWEALEPGFGYVRITNFQARTARDLVRAVESLKEAGPLHGLVLDLRNNPGGVLNGAVGVSDAFLDSGLIVYTEGRLQESQFRYTASPGDVAAGAPIVVLVNEGSASASEIVAGALQDHKRAVIMGVQTFGKGSVQTILPLAQETAIKLTTARYYTPDGRSIQAEGIEPDIRIEPLTVARNDDGAARVSEANLDRHLRGNNEHDDNGAADAEEPSEPLAQRDYALNEALNLLKGLAILGQRS